MESDRLLEKEEVFTPRSRLSRSPTATRMSSAPKDVEMEMLRDNTKGKGSEPREDEGDVAASRPHAAETGNVTETSETGKSDPWQDEEVETSPIYKLQARKHGSELHTPKIRSPALKKRKRDAADETSEESHGKEMSAVLTAMSNVMTRMDELMKHIQASSKTKMEIKSSAKSLNNMVGTLNRKISELKRSQEDAEEKLNNARECDDNDKELAVNRNKRIECRSISTQVNNDELESELSQLKAGIRMEIEGHIVDKAGWAGLSKIIDLTWEESSFVNTKVKVVQNYKNLKEDVAVIVDPDSIANREAADETLSCFPDMAHLINGTIKEGEIEYIKTSMQTLTSKGGRSESSRIMYVVPYRMKLDGVNDIPKLYECVNSLGKLIHTHGPKQIVITALGNVEVDYLKKCVEFVFRGSGINIEILTTRTSKRTKYNQQHIRNLQQTEKVIVKSNGRQYADVLRTIKNGVHLDQIGVKLKTIKKTTTGDVLLEVKGGKEKAEALKQTIRELNQDEQITIRNNDDVLHITDIDGDIDWSGLMTAISESVRGLKADGIKVLSLKPNQWGSQNATVALGKVYAKELIRQGTIKIGWISCRVRPRVYVVRCYRCLEFGHVSSTCKADDKSKSCLNCGKEGHRAKECQNLSFCFTCKKEGHRADRMKCPHYKRIIEDKAKAIAIKTNTRSTNPASTNATVETKRGNDSQKPTR
ncbi:zinc knuckle [Holotrichia oblita]|uniref:Zinc knuckle n=1 Tax=Holotrichia oblita TaxID=644536 RepID=A0ACB9SXQ0_HOLOL|nr:zinc knuckle [Holotrichia oblita]